MTADPGTYGATPPRPRAETRAVRASGVLITGGAILGLGASPALILAGIAALVVGVVLAFRYGVTTGRWEA